MAGPFVKAAFICDRLLKEEDGTPSAIRIIDQVVLEADTPLPQPINVILYVMLSPGDRTGQAELRLVGTSPDGSPFGEGRATIQFPARPELTISFVFPIVASLEALGVYWFDVRVDELLLTRVALTVARRTS